MKKIMRNHLQRENAQTMIEFALVFPILLLIVYGLMEFGRMLFIYSSTTSAAREGARYGAASGGMPGHRLPQYADCDGIKEAAMRSGTFADLQAENITIDYDHGPGISFPISCPPYNADGLDLINNPPYYYDRIIVEVTTWYAPIIPVPGIKGFEISSQNARTIINNVVIAGTPPPVFYTDTPMPTRTLTPNPTQTSAAQTTEAMWTETALATLIGQPTSTITLTPTFTLTPTQTLTPTITLTPTNTSTPTATQACLISSGAMTFHLNSLDWTITNLSSNTVRLTSLTLTWPQTVPNAKLDVIRGGGITLWSGNALPPFFQMCETCGTTFEGLASYREVGGNGGTMGFGFTFSTALPHGPGMIYSIDLVFLNLVNNESCSASISQVYP
jgi:hypothetical protein